MWDKAKKIQNIEILSKFCQETSMMNGWTLKREMRIGIKNLKTLKHYEKSSKNQSMMNGWMLKTLECYA
jgi:hypothetical protein